jgi:hypothetical protein
MSSVLIDLVQFAGLILIPIIPSFFLLKFLPSKAWVSGILKGWKISLTGGFAAYFALLLLLLPVFWPRADQEVWKIEGQIKFKSARGPEPPTENVKFSVHPPNPMISAAGDFDLYVAVDRRAGPREFPDLLLEHQGYQTESIILNKDKREGWAISEDYKVKYLPWKRKIMIIGPIILKEK